MRMIFPPEYVTKTKGMVEFKLGKSKRVRFWNDYVTFPHVEQVLRIERSTYNLDEELMRTETAYGVSLSMKIVHR